MDINPQLNWNAQIVLLTTFKSKDFRSLVHE